MRASLPVVVVIAVVAAVGATVGAAAPAAAAPRWVTGEVIRADGRWTADGSRIVTDATVRTIDGEVLVVSQLGGHAGGYTMVVWHGQPALEPGLRVRLALAPDPRRPGAAWLADDVVVEDATRAAPAVRTTTRKSGRPLAWAKSCVEVTRARDGTSGLAGDLEQDIAVAALATWNQAVAGCSYLDLVDRGAEAREVGRDFVNVIKFRDDRWCRPAVDDDPERCFNAQAAGVTTVTFVDDPDDPRDGEIVDADIELNNVTFRITVDGQGSGAAPCAADLANTRVHELGHLLGLEHTCRAPGDPERVDLDGAAVPLCTSTTDPEITEATMYPFQACAETKKATVEADDVRGVCAAHPLADDPGACGPPDELGGGCCDARGDGASSALLALLVATGLSARRRRSAPRPSPARP